MLSISIIITAPGEFLCLVPSSTYILGETRDSCTNSVLPEAKSLHALEVVIAATVIKTNILQFQPRACALHALHMQARSSMPLREPRSNGRARLSPGECASDGNPLIIRRNSDESAQSQMPPTEYRIPMSKQSFATSRVP